MKVDFYQLGGSTIERVIPRLAERIIAEGGRLILVSADEDQLARLDAQLWAYAPESFLPHAREGSGADADQPLLLSTSTEAANGATTIALVDGQWRDEALGYERALHFFDEEHLEPAREAWRALVRQAVPATFWRQEGGRWQKGA